jgi:hypothetical protein
VKVREAWHACRLCWNMCGVCVDIDLNEFGKVVALVEMSIFVFIFCINFFLKTVIFFVEGGKYVKPGTHADCVGTCVGCVWI